MIALLLLLLLCPGTAGAADFSATGYYRNRLVFYHDLDTQRPSSVDQGGLGDNDRFGSMLFDQQRFRLEPALKLNDNLSIHSQFDILDNIVSGTESVERIDFLSPIIGTIQLPGAGGAIGVNGGEAGENKALNVRRVYLDLLTPAGKFRVGRQPSHWGLGVFQNSGNDLEDDFGDTSDRFLYLASLDSEKIGTVSFGAVADFVFTRQTDPRISGLGGALTTPPEDMRQFAGILLYEREENLAIGTFSGIRYRNGVEGDATTTARPVLVDANGNAILDAHGNNQLGELQAAGKDGDTLLAFTDLYLKVKRGRWKFQGEYGLLTGKIATGLALDAITFNNLPTNARGPIEMPSTGTQNTLLVHLGAAELEGNFDFGDLELRTGYASGDGQPLSQRITQFGFRPDYQIALLLFHVPLGSSPRVTQANADGTPGRVLVGAVPVTGNFINNAAYITAGYWHHLDLKPFVPKAGPARAGLKLITAWAPENNFDLDFSQMIGIADLPHVVQSQKWYGLEADGNFQGRFFDHFLFDLTGGVLIPGQVYDVQADILINPTNAAGINTIVPDPANWVWGIRTALTAEF